MKSKGLSDESIKLRPTSDNSLNPALNYFNNLKFRVKLNKSCLTTDRVFNPNKRLNLYIVFEIKSWPYYNENSFNLRNSLYGGVKLTKNPDPDKYSYSEYCILFDVLGSFSLSSCAFGKDVVIFEADLSSSVHVDNKKRYLNSW